MTTFAISLKSEIARVARKELKQEILALKKSVASQRSDIAALKRQIKTLIAEVKATKRKPKAAANEPTEPKAQPKSTRKRFNAERLVAHRSKLGLTQTQMAALLGASALSVSKWEGGKAQPRAAQLQRIAEVMKLGKREAAVRLAAL